MRLISSRPLAWALALLLALGTYGTAAARPFNGNANGAGLNDGLDSDGDGTSGASFSLTGNSNLGEVAVTGYAEIAPRFAPGGCGSGSGGVRRAVTVAAAVIQVRDGLIYWRGAGTSCAQAERGSIRFTLEGEITGGTRQFLNAGGKLQLVGIADVLVADPQAQFFGGVELKFSGTLTP
jgi:hypothetical protein